MPLSGYQVNKDLIHRNFEVNLEIIDDLRSFIYLEIRKVYIGGSQIQIDGSSK